MAQHLEAGRAKTIERGVFTLTGGSSSEIIPLGGNYDPATHYARINAAGGYDSSSGAPAFYMNAPGQLTAQTNYAAVGHLTAGETFGYEIREVRGLRAPIQHGLSYISANAGDDSGTIALGAALPDYLSAQLELVNIGSRFVSYEGTGGDGVHKIWATLTAAAQITWWAYAIMNSGAYLGYAVIP